MRVLVLHTLAPDWPIPGRCASEFDLRAPARAIADVLPCAEVAGIRGEPGEVLDVLDTHQPDVVFNLCEAPMARPELEAHAAALLEWQGVPFTGSSSTTLALCRRKDLANALLRSAGIAVPGPGSLPCIVKPVDQDGSAGIDHDSVCHDAIALERARSRLMGPVLVEEYLPGTEYAVSLWGGCEPEHIAVAECVFADRMRIVTYAAKWDLRSEDHDSYSLEYRATMGDSGTAIEETARSAWRVLGIRGYARVDIRLDRAGLPHVIDVNPNPEISPGTGIHRAVIEGGWTWDRFVQQQLMWALDAAHTAVTS